MLTTLRMQGEQLHQQGLANARVHNDTTPNINAIQTSDVTPNVKNIQTSNQAVDQTGIQVVASATAQQLSSPLAKNPYHTPGAAMQPKPIFSAQQNKILQGQQDSTEFPSPDKPKQWDNDELEQGFASLHISGSLSSKDKTSSDDDGFSIVSHGKKRSPNRKNKGGRG